MPRKLPLLINPAGGLQVRAAGAQLECLQRVVFARGARATRQAPGFVAQRAGQLLDRELGVEALAVAAVTRGAQGEAPRPVGVQHAGIEIATGQLQLPAQLRGPVHLPACRQLAIEPLRFRGGGREAVAVAISAAAQSEAPKVRQIEQALELEAIAADGALRREAALRAARLRFAGEWPTQRLPGAAQCEWRGGVTRLPRARGAQRGVAAALAQRERLEGDAGVGRADAHVTVECSTGAGDPDTAAGRELAAVALRLDVRAQQGRRPAVIPGGRIEVGGRERRVPARRAKHIACRGVQLCAPRWRELLFGCEPAAVAAQPAVTGERRERRHAHRPAQIEIDRVGWGEVDLSRGGDGVMFGLDRELRQPHASVVSAAAQLRAHLRHRICLVEGKGGVREPDGVQLHGEWQRIAVVRARHSPAGCAGAVAHRRDRGA